MIQLSVNLKTNFTTNCSSQFFLRDTIIMLHPSLQLATGPSVQTLGRNAIDALLSGASFHFVKPVLATEVRRIMPTAAGVPMELSLYTAAVAAAAVQGEQELESIHSLVCYSSFLLMLIKKGTDLKNWKTDICKS